VEKSKFFSLGVSDSFGGFDRVYFYIHRYKSESEMFLELDDQSRRSIDIEHGRYYHYLVSPALDLDIEMDEFMFPRMKARSSGVVQASWSGRHTLSESRATRIEMRSFSSAPLLACTTMSK